MDWARVAIFEIDNDILTLLDPGQCKSLTAGGYLAVTPVQGDNFLLPIYIAELEFNDEKHRYGRLAPDAVAPIEWRYRETL